MSNSRSSNIFLEASDNIHTMHEIERIIENEDIPARSRSHFLKFMSISLNKNLTKKQQKNVKMFSELFIRVDKYTRMFRTFLNITTDLAAHFKLENPRLIFALKNISIEEHFLEFVEFAKRPNPVIDKNSPLNLVLSLGISFVRLALDKNQQSTSKQNEILATKKTLLAQYNDLSKDMCERFISMDFGDDIISQHAIFNEDLDNFNNDDDDDCCDIDDIDINANVKNVSSKLDEINNKNHIEVKADVHSVPDAFANGQETEDLNLVIDSRNLENLNEHPIRCGVVDVDTSVKSKSDSNLNDDYDQEVNIIADDQVDDILENITEDFMSGNSDDQDSCLVKEYDSILKPLGNGDRELNMKNLDSLVMEAGRQFGPSVLSTINSVSGAIEKKSMARFNNYSAQNIVSFINQST